MSTLPERIDDAARGRRESTSTGCGAMEAGNETATTPTAANELPSPQGQHAVYGRRRSLADLGRATLEEDKLLFAFSCRSQQDPERWIFCGHTECQTIHSQWKHLNTCPKKALPNNNSNSCEECVQFQHLILLHAVQCTAEDCVVTLCPDAKKKLEEYRETNVPNSRSPPKRSQSVKESLGSTRRFSTSFESFDDSSPLSFPNYVESFQDLNRIGVGPLPTGLVTSYRWQAEQIVRELEREESFNLDLPPADFTPKGTNVPQAAATAVPPSKFAGPLGGVLSPIEEQPTPIASPCAPEEKFPSQSILHHLNPAMLTVGQDGRYLHRRDYNLNEHLGAGGFGTCAAAKDHTTGELFVVKSNKMSDDSIISSLHSESNILSQIPEHENITRFLGAILEKDHFSRSFLLMMELAEHGSLADMLRDDEEGMEPLSLDQSLFYLQQILQGVYHLHSNSILHLDIKADNILVLDKGRRVKLTDFGTAVRVSEVAGTVSKLKGYTPHFTAPEIILGEIPSFSSDIWSSVCVLIQMITAQLPGCVSKPLTRENIMFLVGNYKDKNIEDLVPLSQMEMEESVVAIFCEGLKANPKSRPSAWQMLHYPVLIEACEYIKCFDEDYSLQPEPSVEQVVPEPHPEGVEPYCTPPTSLPLLITGDNKFNDDVSLDRPRRKTSQQEQKRPSQDSGIPEGSAFDRTLSEVSNMSGAYTVSPMSTCSYHQDSSRDTPCLVPEQQLKVVRSNTREQLIMEERDGKREKERARGACAYASHPEVDFMVGSSNNSSCYRMRSHSATYYRRISNQEEAEPWVDHAHYDYEYLTYPPMTCRDHTAPLGLHWDTTNSTKVHPGFFKHSNSAPVVMTGERDGGRQGMKIGNFKEAGSIRKLRRSSSEVYVDRGPDIDSPEVKADDCSHVTPTATLTPVATTTSATNNFSSSSAEARSSGPPVSNCPPSLPLPLPLPSHNHPPSSSQPPDRSTGYHGCRRSSGPSAAEIRQYAVLHQRKYHRETLV